MLEGWRLRGALAAARGDLSAARGAAPDDPDLAFALASTRSRGTGWVFAVGGAGGAVLPAVAGWMLDGGSLDGVAASQNAAFAIPVVGLVALGMLFGAERRR